MNQNSNAIITLCSHLCVGDGVQPLEPKEWATLAQILITNKLQPMDLFDFSLSELMEKTGLERTMAERILRLMERNASLSFELNQYQNMGISVITRADAEYPAKLKKVLGNHCPPVFYCAGNPELLNRSTIGYVGSRTVSEEDIRFTTTAVAKTLANGYGVVTGGAKGTDLAAETAILQSGGIAIEYLSDSMLKKIQKGEIIKAIQNNRLLLLSVVKPDAGFQVGIAMMRNRYIYAQSSGTVVVRSEFQKGGTWAGAVENLTHKWCPEFCWNRTSYRGNQALIEKGAIPIGEAWDGNVENLPAPNFVGEQISLFD